MPPVTRADLNMEDLRRKSGESMSLASFTSLPTEIIANIASHLDLRSTLLLAQVSRRCPEAIQQRLWRDLDVSVMSDRFAESTGIVLGGVKLADQHKAAVAAKLQGILLRGNVGRYGAVGSVTLAPRPGFPTHGLMTLLQLVSPNLRSLTFVGASAELDWDDYDLIDHAPLDFPLLESGIQFPALTRVVIQWQSIQYLEFLPLLCNSAPNLSWLDAHVTQDLIPTPLDHLVRRFPDFQRDTAIRHLRVDFGVVDPHEDTTAEHPPIDPEHVVIRLLLHSPLTERLQIDYYSNLSQGGRIFDNLRGAMTGWGNLRDVFWAAWTGDLRNEYDDPEDAQDFSSLRRCILRPREFVNFFENLPWGDNLHHVHFQTEHRLLPDPEVTYPTIPAHLLERLDDAQHLIQISCSNLQVSPFLRYITFGHLNRASSAFEAFDEMDELVRSGKAAGYVDSFQHGDKEVLQVRLLMPWLEIHDSESEDYHTVGIPETPTSSCLDYYDDGVDRSRTFEQLPSAVWQTFTDFEGKVVPLEVLEEMRQVQGLSDEEWLQRGVEVGDAAWRVLTDWYDGLVDAGEVGGP